MKKKLFSKATAILLTLAMLVSMTAINAFAASAANDETQPVATGWWTDAGNYDTSWYNDTGTTFTLTTANQLAGLAVLVSGGKTFAGKTVELGDNIDLSAHYWVPIGGNRGVSGGVPTGYSFAGIFNGGRTVDGKIVNYTVSGLNISWNAGSTRPDDGTTILTNVSYGGFGLFGKAAGTVENVTVTGTITSNAIIIGAGGVVEYTTGNVYNCESNVTISCTNEASAQIGGVVGEVYNHAIRLVRHIQYCVNKGAVTGGKQVGGIVGEADCYPQGGIVTDNCVNTGNITTVLTSDNAEVGGIVGFSEGFLTNSYSIATITSNGGSQVAGLVGQLRAQNPEARVNNCYAIPVFKGTTADKFSWLYGTVNGSNTLPITNVLWCEALNTSSSGVSGVTQTIATGNNQQGYWTDTGTATNAAMTAAATGTANVYSSTGTGYTTDTTKTVLTILGSEFTTQSGMNSDYPVLTWQVNGLTSEEEDDAPVISPISDLISGSTYEDAVPGTIYTIYNETDLNTLRGYVGSGKITSGVIFRLMDNISLENSCEPIGSYDLDYDKSNVFAGTFEGNGKTISNLNISALGKDHIGLFSSLAPEGRIESLTISSGSVTGGKNTGAVVGRSYGTVVDCKNTGCAVTSNGVSAGVGGVVGSSWRYDANSAGTVVDCSNSGAVTGTGNSTYTGGVVGKAETQLSGCTNSGTVDGKNYVGGVVGYCTVLPASDCTNSGTVISTGTYKGEIYGYYAGVQEIAGDCTINSGGSYIITGNSNITISVSNNVVLIGNGTAYNVTVNYDTAEAKLTIRDLQVSGPKDNASNVLNFKGTGNTLTIEGTNVLQNDGISNTAAVIHVGAGAGLTIKGDGTLYLYKNSMGAGIGSDTNEASGAITFAHTGVILAKGTKTGATIGGDTAVGNITIRSGTLNVQTNARGAGIGGSAQCAGGNVTISGGNVYITCNWTGHAIGSGANNNNGGNLIITGGSLQTRNAGSSLTDLINATIKDGSGNSLTKLDLNLADTAFEYEDFTVSVDDETAWPCSVNHWFYTASDESTMANWSYYGTGSEENFNSTITMYLTATNHTLTMTALHNGSETGTATLTVPYANGAFGTPTVTGSTATVAYLNTGATAATANGTTWYPYKTLAGAQNSGKNVIILDTAAVDSIALSGNWERANGYTGYLFSVANDATLSGMTINGGGVGTIVDVTGGTLTLSGGVTMTSCDTAVNLTGGNLTITQATINATQYSVHMGADSGTFNLNPSAANSISMGGTVYLANNTHISAGALLTWLNGTLTIVCENPSVGTVVLEKSSTILPTEVSKVVYMDAAYRIIRNTANTRQLVLAE